MHDICIFIRHGKIGLSMVITFSTPAVGLF